MSILNPDHTRTVVVTFVIAMTTILLILFSSSSASAIGLGPAGWYSFGGSDCNEGSRTDPIGALFRGRRASAHNVASQIKVHLGWDHNVHKGQYLWMNTGSQAYDCRYADESVASGPDVPPTGRFHTRLWFVPATGGSSELKTVGTPHHEDWVWHNPLNNDCSVEFIVDLGFGGHAVDKGGLSQGIQSGFDRARHELKQGFQSGGHEVQAEEWGNTKEFKQCDGDWAGSDGWGVNIWVNHAMEPRTRKATFESATSSKLNGTLTTDEASTEWWFAYGPTSSQGPSGYPNVTAPVSTLGSAEIDVSKEVSNLVPDATYFVRLFARNQDGEVEEGAEVKYTPPPPPKVIPSEDTNLPGPHAVAHIDGAVDAFYRTPSGALGHSWTEGTTWSQQPVSGTALSPFSVPHPVTQDNGTVDVFWRTPSNGLGHAWNDANGWHAEALSGNLASEPHPTAQPDGTIDVFYRTPSGGLGHSWYEPGGQWLSNTLPGSVASDPYPVSQSSGNVDVFWRTPSGGLGHAWTEGGSWSQQDVSDTSLSSSSTPHPVTQDNGTVDVFWRTPNNGLGHAWNDANGWHAETLSGTLASEPHPTAQPDGTIDVFHRTQDDRLGHSWYQAGGQWHSNTLSESVASDPFPTAQSNGTVDVFWRTPSNGVGHAWTQGGIWSDQTLPGSVDGSGVPQAVAQPSGVIDAFYRTPSGGLGHNWHHVGWQANTLAGSVGSAPVSNATTTSVEVKEVLNGSPGWATVGGWVNSAGGFVGSGHVNVTFAKWENGSWVNKNTVEAAITSGYYQANYVTGLSRGYWLVRAAFPATGGLLGSESSGQQFEVRDGYRVISQASGKCLDVTNVSTANGTPLQQWDCLNPTVQFNQVFVLVPQGTSSYQIVARHSWKCADVGGWSQSPGASVIQWDCGPGHGNQGWEALPTGGGYYNLKVKHSGQCMDLWYGSTTNGAPVTQFPCHTGANQRWTFQSVNTS